jgi:hypothetical protein
MIRAAVWQKAAARTWNATTSSVCPVFPVRIAPSVLILGRGEEAVTKTFVMDPSRGRVGRKVIVQHKNLDSFNRTPPNTFRCYHEEPPVKW